MILCIIAIGVPDDMASVNTKTSFWSFSIAYAYLNLVFRLERSQVFGSYTYAFRKIMLTSIRVVPIVISLFLGFAFAFNVRSRISSNPGQDYEVNEVHPMGKYVSSNIIFLTLMFRGRH